MMKHVFLALCLFSSSAAMAAPEIKGSPDELQAYLTAIPKVISISASAEKVLVSSEALMTLSVKTEAKKISEALQTNYDIRANLRKALIELGIKESNISESKYSSTPEYGMFSDEPKSYTVSNVVSVKLMSEEQMIAVSEVADNNDKIRYLSTKATLLEKEKIRAELVSKAMTSVKAKASIYEDELNVKLVAVEVNEVVQNFIANSPRYNKSSKILSSAGIGGVFESKELSLDLTVKYQLYPNK